jgi:hypothetical protein
LCLTLPCCGSATEEHNQSSDRPTGAEFGGMGCIKAADEFITLDHREFRKVWIFNEEIKGHFWESIKWSRSNADDPP